MKYHTIGSSSVSGEAKKSGFTIYADMDISQNKMAYTETDMKKVREELESVQKALKLQTKRCRQLVAEYTRKLQEKEQLYQSEKDLRDNQLAKVLKALLIFEARLRQEQKFISHQLSEKDYIIKTQTNDIKKLLASQYCKNCNQFYAPSPATLESFDSSSEYVGTEQDYQSSNFESLDSSSETYATLSERGYTKSESDAEEKIKEKHIYQKNRYNSQGRRKVPHKKNIGTYFEVLKLRNDSPLSNEDNTSADYDNFDSLPPESISDKISVVSDNIENMLNKTRNIGSTTSESSINITSSECGKTVINTKVAGDELGNGVDIGQQENKNSGSAVVKKNEDKEKSGNKDDTTKMEYKLTETIPVFEGGDINDNWYASASDQEDEEHRDIYRNNPVLECMNQILLQNINDINSPPKTPNIERKTSKNNKRVKFSDEEDKSIPEESVDSKPESQHDYYETPIQKTPNFYETPQSIYSNDYEQILSKCSETFSDTSKPEVIPRKSVDVKVSHHYIEMEKSPDSEKQENNVSNIVRKNKILRVPPALPPKPPNLVSKYKIQNLPKRPPSEHGSSVDLEPDYCSISELNLPQTKNVSGKKINVVAEVHSPTSVDVKTKMSLPTAVEKAGKKTEESVLVNNNVQNEDVPNLVVKKCVEKFNIQLATKQTTVRSEGMTSVQSPKKKIEIEIPKLPQVSEIIIPDDPEESEEDRISQDNYVKNNTQVLQSKNFHEPRKPILMGSTVSSLISGFNNQQILNEIKNKPERTKPENKKMFSSFENLQNLDKHFTLSPERTPETPTFENFDLSQNFEEFKLDDCEIEEYNVEEELNKEDTAKEMENSHKKDGNAAQEKPPVKPERKLQSARVDYIRASKDLTMPNMNQKSIEVLKKQLELQKLYNSPKESVKNETKKGFSTEPTYEHFLECTGLSSKSILTPARMLSNHKNMLKPKDVKLRSKVKTSTSIFERHNGTNIKYWSEPFV